MTIKVLLRTRWKSMSVAEESGGKRRVHIDFVLDGEGPRHADVVPDDGELLLAGQGLLQHLVGPPRHAAPELRQPPLELLQLLHAEALHVGVPQEGPSRPLFLHRLLQRVPLLLLRLDQVVQLHALAVELADVRLAAGLDRGRDGGDRRARARGADEEAVDHGVDGRVAEGEDLAGGGEHDDAELRPAEDGELARLLEQPAASLREAHLTSLLVLYPLDFYLLAAHARLPPHH
ncbi:unnamed protein product [Musa banksii]